MGEQMRDVLNADQAAEFLGFSTYTIREKARDGEIPGRKIGREWRFSRRELLEFIEGGSSNRQQQTTDLREKVAAYEDVLGHYGHLDEARTAPKQEEEGGI